MLRIIILTCLVNSIVLVNSLEVIIFSDTPIVRGATAHFTAIITDDNGQNATGSYKVAWTDNAINRHSQTNNIQGALDTWNVTYEKSIYPPGKYEVQVSVSEWFLPFPITSARLEFEITEKFNGALHLLQNNTIRDIFVSNTTPVVHEIRLHESDAELLATATNVMTFWFIDCVNYGPSIGLNFTYNYTTTDDHVVEALIVANFDPITTPAPITTTTIAPNVTQAPTNATTTQSPKVDVKSLRKRSVGGNSTEVPTPDVDLPFVCGNKHVQPKAGNTYGYFQAKVKVKAPIGNITVGNLKWIHRGDMLNINITCDGSGTFKYCYTLMKGEYNVTGNETCQIVYKKEACEIPVKRFLFFSGEWTILLIIYNDISQVIRPISLTVFDVKKQAQLSVIVIPVAFILLAVVLIVFGIAYFIQNRSRFIVEVADFNFGNQSADLEYKTFTERLRDSVGNMFTRVPSPTPSTSEVPVWPPTRKYGSMT